MRATLMHNPTAGSGDTAPEDLLARVAAAGYDVVYQSTKAEDYAAALQDPGDLVVVAGGDGTVRKVVSRLAGRGVPIAILPLGTANNIAGAFGITGPVAELVEGWRDSSRRRLRVGVVSGARGRKEFVESVGMGLFAETMKSFEDSSEAAAQGPGMEIQRVRKRLLCRVEDYPAVSWSGRLDGEPLSGRLVAVLALNVGSFGPRLSLIPDADPGDGLLRVVAFTDGDRPLISRLISEGSTELRPGMQRAGRTLRFRAPELLRIDGKFFAAREEFGTEEELEVRLADSFVEVLVNPNPSAGAQPVGAREPRRSRMAS